MPVVYIWIVLFVFVENTWANVYTQDASVLFRSTSTMMETGSTLPLTIRDGAITTTGSQSPARPYGIISLYSDEGETDEDGGNIDTNVKDPKEVNDSPIGDLSIIELLIGAGLFAIYLYVRKCQSWDFSHSSLH